MINCTGVVQKKKTKLFSLIFQKKKLNIAKKKIVHD
jgi:hypothetical protein